MSGRRCVFNYVEFLRHYGLAEGDPENMGFGLLDRETTAHVIDCFEFQRVHGAESVLSRVQ